MSTRIMFQAPFLTAYDVQSVFLLWFLWFIYFVLTFLEGSGFGVSYCGRGSPFRQCETVSAYILIHTPRGICWERLKSPLVL